MPQPKLEVGDSTRSLSIAENKRDAIKAIYQNAPDMQGIQGTAWGIVQAVGQYVDHFKNYNDQQGHQAGDRLLKQLAGAWSNELRTSDTLARYGGEEFALLLPTCSIERAIDVVARLREATPDGQTCSAGIVYWDGTEAAADLIGRADHALYEAKRAGRDCTVCSPTPT